MLSTDIASLFPDEYTKRKSTKKNMKQYQKLVDLQSFLDKMIKSQLLSADVKRNLKKVKGFVDQQAVGNA